MAGHLEQPLPALPLSGATAWPSAAEPPPAPHAIALVGPANVGKSVLFGALTQRYVAVSNYPGTTVELTTGKATIGGRSVTVIDTPGAQSFFPSSEDELVTRDLLLSGGSQAVLAVGDAKNPERALLLALQLAETGLPFVLCLNMHDEARERGIQVDVDGLAAWLGVPVVPTVAIRRQGLTRLRTALAGPAAGRPRVAYPAAIERALERVIPHLPAAPIAGRALGLMALVGDETLVGWLRARLTAPALAEIDDVRQELRREFHEPLAYVVNRARLDEARRVAARFTAAAAARPRAPRAFGAWLERMTIHPWGGFVVLAGVLYVAYQFVGVLGADTLVGLLEDGLFGRWINPLTTALVERVVPWAFVRDLIVGPYGIVTMALTYALALILPIVTTFFIAFGVLEDSGYLPRLAVIVNRWMKRIGLNGKAVLPMVLGLGCDTMATLTTRILETRKERLIVILLLALGVPCSAQLTVVMAMLGSLSLLAVSIWLGVVLGVIALVGALAARLLPGRSSDFVLELPPLRWPQPSNILVKTMARLEWYLKEAVPLFVLGTLILFVVDRLGWLGGLQRIAAPVVSGLLGLPPEAAGVFILGFLRRDFGAAGLYEMADAGRLDPAQALVAVVTITLFIPCIANFFMIVKERGWKTALTIAAFVTPFALGVGALLRVILAALSVNLR